MLRSLVGSEMCIRDRSWTDCQPSVGDHGRLLCQRASPCAQSAGPTELESEPGPRQWSSVTRLVVCRHPDQHQRRNPTLHGASCRGAVHQVQTLRLQGRCLNPDTKTQKQSEKVEIERKGSFVLIFIHGKIKKTTAEHKVDGGKDKNAKNAAAGRSSTLQHPSIEARFFHRQADGIDFTNGQP